MTTIKDIAREAGVSFTTVSNVIHGNTKKVSPATVEKIQKIMDERNYVPNMGARMLVGNSSKIIGVIANILTDPSLEGTQTPFMAEILGSIEKEIRKNGYYMMLCFSNSASEIKRLMSTWNVDGVITVSLGTEVSRRLARLMKIPVVCTDCYFRPEEPYYNVGTLDEEGGYLVTKYLIEKGHRRFAVVTDFPYDHKSYEHSCGKKRVEGFFRALEEAKIPGKDSVVYSGHVSYEKQLLAFERLYKNLDKYTAAVFLNDYLAFEGMDYLRQKGVEIPKDLSVVGFDDIDMARFAYPRLTTIHQGVGEKGRTTVQQLMALLHKDASVEKNIQLSVKLIERDSVLEWKET